MTMERKVTKINPLPQYITNKEFVSKRRAAVYIRVSTDKEEQLNSYENQKDYYPKLIASRPDWTFAGLYSDEGISATSTAHRDGFNRLISDALSGQFDLIVTKSISRFARNTVDTLNIIRKLKAGGVEVYFEREDIFTFDGKGEFMLTLLSGLAQEESRSLSENTTWGIRKGMADGKYHMPYAQFLGYEKGVDGKPVIVEKEADVVRRIFRLFLQRYSANRIAEILSSENIPSPAGKQEWTSNTVLSMLRNEKYAGNALLQKGYTEDFLTKKRAKNNGELPQYLVEGGHRAIVSPAVFEEVQRRLAQIPKKRTNKDCGFLSNMVICGNCGELFGRKIIGNYAGLNKYKHDIWRCTQTYRKSKTCRMPFLYQEVAAFTFNQAMSKLLTARSDVVTLCRETIDSTIDNKARMVDIEYKLKKFKNRSPLDIPFDIGSFRTIVERVIVLSDNRIRFHFITGTVAEFPIPHFTKIANNFIAGSILEKSLENMMHNYMFT